MRPENIEMSPVATTAKNINGKTSAHSARQRRLTAVRAADGVDAPAA
jgi:hypothetical protein